MADQHPTRLARTPWLQYWAEREEYWQPTGPTFCARELFRLLKISGEPSQIRLTAWAGPTGNSVSVSIATDCLDGKDLRYYRRGGRRGTTHVLWDTLAEWVRMPHSPAARLRRLIADGKWHEVWLTYETRERAPRR